MQVGAAKTDASRSLDRARISGFSLIELMVALAVFALLINFAAPSFENLVDSRRLISRYNLLASDLRLARLEAIKTGRDVSVCARGAAGSCGTDWSRGWHIFTELSAAAGGTDGQIDANERRIFSRVGDANDMSIIATATVRPAGTGAQTFVRFDGRGRAGWSLGNFVLCDERGAEDALGLIVAGAGGFRSAYEPPGGSGVVIDAFGDPVTCPS